MNSANKPPNAKMTKPHLSECLVFSHYQSSSYAINFNPTAALSTIEMNTILFQFLDSP
ncbi:hypothetical protein PAECIP111891_03582 [Paenibacillus allorhizoplanae]|uniref:Uncharacterized protein n=1 Tax=Paenibacillus allorhizoplanae TaxID=2905648 RepID=A0ABN8GM44_9BACL|nr:hypothetical protein PAECIP111891_03582 [Paenibacillus allorhizoplanae]